MNHARAWTATAVAFIAGCAISLFIAHTGGPRIQAAEPEFPQRIICMAPSNTEAVFMMGAGDRVVGVSRYSVFPSEAREKPDVGALYDPNLERIVALQPDLIIIQEKHAKVEELCAAKGIAICRVDMTSVAGILDGIKEIGRRIGTERKADELTAQISAELAAVQQRVREFPRKSVFFCLGRSPGSLKGLFTIGRTSFLSELIDIAGGKNIFDDLSEQYPQISAESLLQRSPQVIIETYPSEEIAPERAAQLRQDWQALGALPAVKDNRIEILNEDYLLIPGPRIGMIARRLAQALHPEGQE